MLFNFTDRFCAFGFLVSLFSIFVSLFLNFLCSVSNCLLIVGNGLVKAIQLFRDFSFLKNLQALFYAFD